MNEVCKNAKEKKKEKPTLSYFHKPIKCYLNSLKCLNFFMQKKKIKMADFHIRSIWIQLQSCLMPMKKFERLVPDFVQKCR